VACGRSSAAEPATAEAIAKPKPNAEAPLPGWLAKNDKKQALNERIRDLQKQHGIMELIEEHNRLAVELERAKPEGMDYNPASRHFEWKPGLGPKPPEATPPALSPTSPPAKKQ
jgi:hypothetical protein